LKTSDWIAIVSTIVSAVALIVSARIALIAVRIQATQSKLEREQAQKDAENDLADLTRDLANKVSQIGFLTPGPELAAAQAELNGLVIAVSKMSDEYGGNWYMYYSLAAAYALSLDTNKARDLYDKALAAADSKPSRNMILAGQAWLFYNSGEIDQGRDIFRKVMQENAGSDDRSRQVLANVLSQQAFTEYIADNKDVSAKLFGEAWSQAKTIKSQWSQQMVSDAIASSLLRTFGREPKPSKTLPEDLVRYAIELDRLQFQGPGVYQPGMPTPPDIPTPEVLPMQPEPMEQQNKARRPRRAGGSSPSDKR
jgi:hypothetical protein